MNLQENINQVNSDFQKIKSAIIESGVSVEDGTPTSELGDKIKDIYEQVETSLDNIISIQESLIQDVGVV